MCNNVQLNLWPNWRIYFAIGQFLTIILLQLYYSSNMAHFYFLQDNVKYMCIKNKKYRNKALTHKTSRIVGINANLSIHLNQALHDDLSNFAISQGILQSITQKDNQRKWFPKFVRTRGRSGGVHTSQFVQHPCFRRIKTFKMLLRATSLKEKVP